MQNVNLLNIKLKKDLQPLSAQKMGKYFVLMVIVSIVMYSYFEYQIRKQEAELSKVEHKVKSQEVVMQQLQQKNKPKEKDPTLPYIIRQAEADILGYQIILAELRLKDKDSKKFSQYFETLATNKVDGLWVNDFYVSNFTKEMVIGGGSTVPENVSEFIRLLSMDKVMEKQTFQNLMMIEGQLASLYSPLAGNSGNGGNAQEAGAVANRSSFLQFKLESNTSKG